MNQKYLNTTIVVDRAEYGYDWVFGYLNNNIVVKYQGVSDINAIELFDAKGNKVIPVPAPPSFEDRQTAMEHAILEMAGEIFG